MDKNNQDTGEFAFVQEKIKSKRKKKVKRVLALSALTLFLAALFGLTARMVFIKSEKLANALLGIDITPAPAAAGTEYARGEVTFPATGQLIVPSKTPTPAPTNTPTPTPKPVPSKAASATPTPEATTTPAEPSAVLTEAVTPQLTEEVSQEPERPDDEGATAGAEGNADNDGTEGNKTEGDKIEGDKTEGDKTEGDGTESGKTEGSEGKAGTDESVTPTASPLEEYAAMMKELRELASKTEKSLTTVTTVTSGVNWLDESIETTEEITGVILGENKVELLILTRYDKVKSADRIEVTMGENAIAASLYGFDSDYNMAVVAIPLNEIPSEGAEYSIMALGDCSEMYVGMPVIALGSPNGYNGSVEFGTITGMNTAAYITDGMVELFTTNMSDNENSDGIIVNLKGEMIGITTRLFGNSATDGVCTAVDADSLKQAALDLLNGVSRIHFGIKAENIPAGVLEGMELENGIYVNEVESMSPAYAAGIKKGDVIISIDDKQVYNLDEFEEIIAGQYVGHRVSVGIYRSSKREDKLMSVALVLTRKTK